MSGRPSFVKMILLIVSGAALACFGCLGAISAGQDGTRLAVGGIGFVGGLILLLVGLYYALIWIIDRLAPPSARPAAAPPPPPHHAQGPGDANPPQSPQV